MKSLILFLLLPVTLAAQSTAVLPGMQQLADRERAFAATSVREGIRASFLRFFADDGIAFQPGPVIYQDAVRDLPAPADPHAFTLDWKPVFGDIASSGELGYTTGPYVLTENRPDPKPPSTGFYFSVWEKQADGEWKVALDIGVPTPSSAAETGEFQQATSRSFLSDPSSVLNARQTLMEAEAGAAEAARRGGIQALAREWFLGESRMHRPGHSPAVGKQAVLMMVSGDSTSVSMDVMFGKASRSGNLGYSYGRYKREDRVGHAGFFARVWKKDENGSWKIVADITSPKPEAE